MTESAEARVAATRVTRPWRYAIGMFGTSIRINMVKGSMILYYVDILGLDVRAGRGGSRSRCLH